MAPVPPGPRLSQTAILLLKLFASLAIDAIGASSFILPILGELSDIGWAPVSAALVWYLYGDRRFAALNFVEEVLPFTDWIPSATLAWLAEVVKVVNTAAGREPAQPASNDRGGARNADAASSAASDGWQNIQVPGVGPLHWSWLVAGTLVLVALAFPYRA